MNNQHNRGRKMDKILHKCVVFVQSIVENNESLLLAEEKVKAKKKIKLKLSKKFHAISVM
jgi:hypothetical protein